MQLCYNTDEIATSCSYVVDNTDEIAMSCSYVVGNTDEIATSCSYVITLMRLPCHAVML